VSESWCWCCGGIDAEFMIGLVNAAGGDLSVFWPTVERMAHRIGWLRPLLLAAASRDSWWRSKPKSAGTGKKCSGTTNSRSPGVISLVLVVLVSHRFTRRLYHIYPSDDGWGPSDSWGTGRKYGYGLISPFTSNDGDAFSFIKSVSFAEDNDVSK